ncbi:hypothetical protein EV191_1391 [Tamaricihabitans halophyticus]|uniref:Uncharacterized protein n=2 Tax=Tamaricihabitans halophyticus TaxID=1262583 RepID=A0A4R2PSC7_9PSEU
MTATSAPQDQLGRLVAENTVLAMDLDGAFADLGQAEEALDAATYALHELTAEHATTSARAARLWDLLRAQTRRHRAARAELRRCTCRH